ncbi:MAG: sigma factor-like helix-turn-helix DNA-binding protein [Candidatus Sumerlaeota bacterium]
MANGKVANPEERMVRVTLLLDAYGKLLTDRQRTFMRLHFDEDLSFSDIAREHGISRQAVHDSVKHAIASLDNLEDNLGLVSGNGHAQAPETHVAGRQLIERLTALRERVGRECCEQHSPWVVNELSSLIALLNGENA